MSVENSLQTVPSDGIADPETRVSLIAPTDATSHPQNHNVASDQPPEQDVAPDRELRPELDTRARSEAQIRASQVNGRKSHGPKTECGKNISRGNAVKDGLFARTLLLGDDMGEDGVRFRRLLEGLRKEFKDFGIREEIAIQNLALAIWRRQKGFECEAAYLEGSLFDPSLPGEPPKVFSTQSLDRILRYNAAAQKLLTAALDELEPGESDDQATPDAGKG